MSISNVIEKLADAIAETYFQLLDQPLPGWGRFLCAWLGAATLFGSMFIIQAGPGILVSTPPSIWVLVLSVIVAPSLFGLIIALARTRHGPVRLYLSGLLLSAFVVVLVIRTWSP